MFKVTSKGKLYLRISIVVSALIFLSWILSVLESFFPVNFGFIVTVVSFLMFLSPLLLLFGLVYIFFAQNKKLVVYGILLNLIILFLILGSIILAGLNYG